jgi:hypothetical protein
LCCTTGPEITCQDGNFEPPYTTMTRQTKPLRRRKAPTSGDKEPSIKKCNPTILNSGHKARHSSVLPRLHLGHQNKSVQIKLTIFNKVYVANFEFYGTEVQPKPSKKGGRTGEIARNHGRGASCTTSYICFTFSPT